jgi:hypothetical protein
MDALRAENQSLREQVAMLRDWMQANVPEMECRMDGDCDHCEGMRVLDAARHMKAEKR